MSGEFDASILIEMRKLADKKEKKENGRRRLSDAGDNASTTEAPEAAASGDTGVKQSPAPRKKHELRAMTMLRDPIARTLSQFEHHISRDRFFEKGAAASSSNDTTVPLLETVEEAQRRRSRTLLDLVSPQRCPQTDRRSAAQCAALTNPRKCRANGWCGIFQNRRPSPSPAR